MHRDIAAIRDCLELTSAGLARLVGVEPRTVWRWLDGTREVPEPVWRLLALVLHVDRTTIARWFAEDEIDIEGAWNGTG